MSDFLATVARDHFAPAVARIRKPGPLPYGVARASFARLGIALRKTEEGEYRVNYARGAEATAAYESDLESAIDTGLAMLAHKARLASELRAIGCPAYMAERDARAAVAEAL
jgi:hypothetical protein